ARNVLDFLKLVVDKHGAFTLNLEDDIVAACLMTGRKQAALAG
ncbi:NAD(P)(+) transhydrogenase (Re/Si-specific) subunit alpha, partial [Cupriavidus sp. WGtm5]|nr:NAD(P)(+) transhydrogenase (Re/Si-specific) subunit alpha [Cupriavidus sp. WGtm5]